MTHRVLLQAAFDRAVAAAHPAGCLTPFLPAFPDRGRLILLAAGKAAASMTEVATRHYAGHGADLARLRGLAVTRHGYGCPTHHIPLIEAGHPVPDEASVTAAEEALRLAGAASAEDLVLVLLSGGASANWVAPQPGVTLEDKQRIMRHLLASGADIGTVNAIRKRLSRIKGGRLAVAAAPAHLVTLAISDVPGDDPAIIGSGPTAPDPVTQDEALALADAVKAPLGAARAVFSPDRETPKADHPAFRTAAYTIIMTPGRMLDAAASALQADGYAVVNLGADIQGEARDIARLHAGMARRYQAEGRRCALLSGGELTVTLRGTGRGGPNQEYALALAIALEGCAGISALAADTDGTDGGSGKASDPAGAFIDSTTLQRAHTLGLDPMRHLHDNDSTGFFAALGDLLCPGPTFTNANDLRLVLVDRKT